MKIYNTLTRTKEEFVPLEKGKVKMYACGITVSGEAHIGHGYQALIYDIMRKFLEKQGYDVTYARNYTDVDDKIIAKSRETGIPADKYAADMIEKIDKIMAEFDPCRAGIILCPGRKPGARLPVPEDRAGENRCPGH